jgi:hypothetical protein
MFGLFRQNRDLFHSIGLFACSHSVARLLVRRLGWTPNFFGAGESREPGGLRPEHRLTQILKRKPHFLNDKFRGL